MVITATEFKMNFGKYLEVVKNEDIFITKNGKTIAKLSNPHISAVDALSGVLTDVLPSNFDRHDLREERMSKYESDD